MKSRVTTALVVMLMTSWVGGCGGEQPAAPPAASEPARGPGLKIAMIAKSTTNPVFVSARKGAETAARELGEKHGIPIQIVWMTPDDEDGELQATAVAQAVKDRASAILISCSDAEQGDRRDRRRRRPRGAGDDLRQRRGRVETLRVLRRG